MLPGCLGIFSLRRDGVYRIKKLATSNGLLDFRELMYMLIPASVTLTIDLIRPLHIQEIPPLLIKWRLIKNIYL